jgi:acyl-CoA dehydrogenase
MKPGDVLYMPRGFYHEAATLAGHSLHLTIGLYPATWIATSAASMAATRLLTLQAAWKIDTEGAFAARTEIAMIKYHGATVMHDVLDRAIQIHGALGFTDDMPLSEMYKWSRAARLYDGPDEVHKVTVAKRILKNYEPHDIPSDHVPTRREAAIAKYGELLDTLALA